MPNQNLSRFFLFLGGFVFIVVVKKALSIPITHDEVSTIFHSQRTIWDIIMYTDPIPNNHIVNTLLLKLSLFLFGDHIWSIRAFNIGSYLLYAYFSYKIALFSVRHIWVSVLFFVGLVSQPYVLDFFTVSRGYGISIAFMMASLYHLCRWWTDKLTERRFLIYCVLYAAIGVYASFTLLNYFIPLWCIVLYRVFHERRRNNLSMANSRYILFWPIFISIILLLLCLRPFIQMSSTGQFVFWGTSGFYQDTIAPFIRACRYGGEYFGWTTENITYGILVIFVSLMAFSIYISQYKSKQSLFYVMLGLMLLLIGYNYAQFYILSIPFLNPRTALFLYPLAIVLISFGIDNIVHLKKTLGLTLSVFLCGLFVQHFVRTYHIRSTYEWYYDENTYDVINDIRDVIISQNLPLPVTVDCHWTYHPSLSYHAPRIMGDSIIITPYHKETNPQSQALFYFIQSDEYDAVKERYDEVTSYAWRQRFLMRRK